MSDQVFTRVMKFMKQQVPVFSLFLQSQTVKYIPTECSYSTNTWAIATFVIISLLTIGWTIWHSEMNFKDKYGHSLAVPARWKYVTLQTTSSYLAYVAISYYIFQGQPYNCLFDYNTTVSGILFWFSAVIICIIASVEHHYWSKVAAAPPLVQILS